MSQEELDKLFQQNSSEHDFKYNEASWSEMETLLDEDDRRYFAGRWWLDIGLLLLGLICCFTIYNNVNTESIVISSDSPERVEKTSVENYTEKKSDSTPVENITKSTENEITATTDYSSNTSEETFTNKNVKADDIIDEHINVQSANQNNQTPNNTNIENVDDVNLIETTPPTRNQVRGSNIKNNTLTNDEEEEKPIAILNPESQIGSQKEEGTVSQKLNSPILKSIALFIANQDSLNLPDINLPVLVDLDKLESTDDDTKTPKNRKLLLGAMLATEASAVGLDNICTPNLKFGLNVEYRIDDKFGLSVGVNYIKKDYGAGSGEYSPPPGFWTDAVAPESSLALCDIIEIPVKGTYFFGDKEKSKNGFYGTLGMTSYILVNETYTYFYDNPVPNSIDGHHEHMENSHWFGFGHVSFGYERFLTPKTSIQLAPYIQIPLTQIGHGNVRVTSFGISGKFNFQVK